VVGERLLDLFAQQLEVGWQQLLLAPLDPLDLRAGGKRERGREREREG
jgi:hypothetical protein